jgi:hypothetical protein
MDILSWTKLNPNIRIRNVNKRFYNQYYYKLEVTINGSGFLRHPELSLVSQAEHRKKHNQQRKVNFGGSWRHNWSKDTTDQDLELLSKVQTAQKNHTDLKIRIEEPTFQIYAVNEEDLYRFALEIENGDNHHIIAINRPQTAKHFDLLAQGYTVSRRPTDYPVKVYIREGRYPLQTKSQVLNYLTNMPDEVYLPKHFVESFSREYESVWNCYFYTKDRSILTMLGLIAPMLVRATEEYHLAPEE